MNVFIIDNQEYVYCTKNIPDLLTMLRRVNRIGRILLPAWNGFVSAIDCPFE